MTVTTRRLAYFAVLLLFAAAPAFAQAVNLDQKINAGHRAAPDCSIRLQGPIATIRVTGWDRDSIAVSGALPKGGRFDRYFGDETGAAVRGVKMLVENPPGRIPPAGTIELKIPVGARIVLQSGSADIEVTGVKGEIDITMLGGSAHITGSPRILLVDAIYATVTLDGSPDRVRLKSAEGDITMRGGSSNAEFSTVKGNIRVGGGTFDHATFDATTGSVAFSGDLTRNATFAITTHSAPVELQLSPKASVRIDATTSQGLIENSFSKAEPPVSEGKDQKLKAELANGTALIKIDSFKGNIRVLRRNN